VEDDDFAAYFGHDGKILMRLPPCAHPSPRRRAAGDTHGTDAKNPLPFNAVKARIESALWQHRGRILVVPNITNGFYGGDVGWTHCVYGLSKLGAVVPQARALGAGAGREPAVRRNVCAWRRQLLLTHMRQQLAFKSLMTITTIMTIVRGESMRTSTWTVAEAKAKLSEVIDLAQSRGPQTITRNGRMAVLIVAAEEWERKTKRTGNLAEFFAASPLRASRLNAKRRKDRPRKVDL
jgi:prevent-host-death family protein